MIGAPAARHGYRVVAAQLHPVLRGAGCYPIGHHWLAVAASRCDMENTAVTELLSKNFRGDGVVPLQELSRF